MEKKQNPKQGNNDKNPTWIHVLGSKRRDWLLGRIAPKKMYARIRLCAPLTYFLSSDFPYEKEFLSLYPFQTSPHGRRRALEFVASYRPRASRFILWSRQTTSLLSDVIFSIQSKRLVQSACALSVRIFLIRSIPEWLYETNTIQFFCRKEQFFLTIIELHLDHLKFKGQSDAGQQHEIYHRWESRDHIFEAFT